MEGLLTTLQRGTKIKEEQARRGNSAQKQGSDKKEKSSSRKNTGKNFFSDLERVKGTSEKRGF